MLLDPNNLFYHDSFNSFKVVFVTTKGGYRVRLAKMVKSKQKRNPTWKRDELLLALELYLDRGQLGPEDPDVIALSQLLNKLPIHTNRPDVNKFRNPNGVALKLANFGTSIPT